MKTNTAYAAETAIRESVQACLADDHNADGVRFVDDLLTIAVNVGEIKCTLAGDYGLRFEVPGQEAWEVRIGRAKSKFRMFLPRFAVLCNESDRQDVSLYGGQGIIRKTSVKNVPANDIEANSGPHGSFDDSCQNHSVQERPAQWSIRFMNTMGEQYLTIHAL